MRVLILGARAPACLEWARCFAAANWTVFVADSLSWPLTRSSNSIQHFIRLPEPKTDPDRWLEALENAILEHTIELVLPTCEEVFYLSSGRKRLEQYCRILCSDFDLLHQLHHKGLFAQRTADWLIKTPETRLLTCNQDLAVLSGESSEWVFKPAYSRFAQRTLISPHASRLDHIAPTSDQPWLAQRFTPGREYCSFSVLIDGKLCVHACYHPRYKVGLGSGIFFEPIHSQKIQDFVSHFGLATGYTGQVGFDFIENKQGLLHVLECNPRATSGIHLFDDQPQALIAALASNTRKEEPLEPTPGRRMIALAMVLFSAPKNGARLMFWRDFRLAQDVLSRPGDFWPTVAQLPALTEVIGRAITRRCGLIAASTIDIEWNGQLMASQSLEKNWVRVHESTSIDAANTNDNAARYVRNFHVSEDKRLIANVSTRMALLSIGQESFPMSINHGQEELVNSYVVSPSTAYCEYAKDELIRLDRPWITYPLILLTNGIGLLLTWARVDKIVFVNNWLLSTNLYPTGWKGTHLGAVTHTLTRNFPAHAHGFRSLNQFSNGELLKQFVEKKYLQVPSRQVYLFDGRQGPKSSFLKHHNCQVDAKLLEDGAYLIADGRQLTTQDFNRIEALYNQLYLDKYSYLNPQFSAQWMQQGQQEGWLDFRVLKNAEGVIEGAVGWFANEEILTAPIVGYNTALPQKCGLYRLLTQLCLQQAAKDRKILNFSSGAAHFKRLRGGQPYIEYSMVHIAHLPFHQRAVWRLLSFLLNNIGVPLMRKLQL